MSLRNHKVVVDALTKSLPFPAFVGHRQITTGHAPFAARLLRCVGFYYLLALRQVFVIIFVSISFYSLLYLHIYNSLLVYPLFVS